MKRYSINSKLKAIAITVFIPMLIAVVYALYSLGIATTSYAKITKSVSYASKMSDYRDQIEQSMYSILIEGKQISELENDTDTNTIDPYYCIEQMRMDCKILQNISALEKSEDTVVRIEKNISKLEKVIRKFETENRGKSVEEKEKFLEDTVYKITKRINRLLRNYIEIETGNIADVRKELNNNNIIVYTVCVLVSVVSIGLSIILTSNMRKSVTVPLKKLCDLTVKVSEGEFTARYTEEKVEKIDEIDVLTKSFNNMTEKIGELVENIKAQEKELHVLELKLLQAQVNPHFLYNTLDTIVWLAEDNQGESVVDMVTALSDFFRTTLSNGKDFITVEEEELHIRSYLQIQQFRYQNIVDYEIEIDKDIKEYVVPKLLLQPLIENALYHGIKNKRGRGLIRITGNKEEEFIIFRVQDSGKGMESELLEKIQKNISSVDNIYMETGYGLVNISRRLKYYYGAESSMEVKSEENKGTEVTIKIKI